MSEEQIRSDGTALLAVYFPGCGSRPKQYAGVRKLCTRQLVGSQSTCVSTQWDTAHTLFLSISLFCGVLSSECTVCSARARTASAVVEFCRKNGRISQFLPMVYDLGKKQKTLGFLLSAFCSNFLGISGSWGFRTNVSRNRGLGLARAWAPPKSQCCRML